METAEDPFTKQYENKELTYENLLRKNALMMCQRPKRDNYHLVHPYMRQPAFSQRQCDEPIDLTQNHQPLKEPAVVELVETDPAAYTIKSRGRKTKIFCQDNANAGILDPGCFKDVIELQATETKQAEILKAAKSLFSKRTRTLYHWMYPNTPKQQIKMAVANSWENLGTQEKQFYISQVLVKFGFPQCNLMVNPQLGGIKELPPLPDTIENNYSAKELQTAISSISDVGGASGGEVKRRQGRPPGSKNKKPKGDGMSYKLTKDFQDDPELSKELEKFAISFDYFK